jgi:hypothetical protein
MTLETLLVGGIALLVGAAFTFAGFRFFLILLPIWGFVIGFMAGAQVVTLIFGDGFFATLLGWGVGLIGALAFAVLSYLFYWVAVVLLGASVGYTIGLGFMAAIGVDFGFLAVAVGVVLGAILAVGVIVLGVPKYLIVILTAVAGASATLAGIFLLIGRIPLDALSMGAVGAIVRDSLVWIVVWLALAGIGIVSQLRVIDQIAGGMNYELERDRYNY